MKLNKKNIIIIVIATVIIVGLLYLLVFKVDSKKYKYTKELKKLASDYYEEYYERFNTYNYTDEQIEKELSRYKDDGRKESLDTLSRVDITKTEEILSKFEGCNPETTKAIIYPHEPYKKKDYSIVITLDCK